MTFLEFMKESRDEFRNNMNQFLSERGLYPLRFLDSAIELDKKKLSLAIYPTASSGSTFEQQNSSNTVRFTVQLYCNSDATEKGLVQGEEYYSAILEFIQSRTFGDSSTLDSSVLCRMDEYEPVNGAIFLISSRISSDMDYGWD